MDKTKSRILRIIMKKASKLGFSENRLVEYVYKEQGYGIDP